MSETELINLDGLAAIVARNRPIKRSGDGFFARCPNHDDHKESLHLFQGRDGKGRFFCFVCGKGKPPLGFSGDAYDWQSWVEGNRSSFKPDPKMVEERKRESERQAQLDRIERRFFDIYVDACPEWSIIIRGMR